MEVFFVVKKGIRDRPPVSILKDTISKRKYERENFTRIFIDVE